MKELIKWTFLGAMGGWALLAMVVTGVFAIRAYMAVGMLPPDLKYALIYGAAIGAVVGCHKIGWRLKLYKLAQTKPLYEEDYPMYDEDLYGN